MIKWNPCSLRKTSDSNTFPINSMVKVRSSTKIICNYYPLLGKGIISASFLSIMGWRQTACTKLQMVLWAILNPYTRVIWFFLGSNGSLNQVVFFVILGQVVFFDILGPTLTSSSWKLASSILTKFLDAAGSSASRQPGPDPPSRLPPLFASPLSVSL